jgi:hypothetical protein
VIVGKYCHAIDIKRKVNVLLIHGAMKYMCATYKLFLLAVPDVFNVGSLN